MYVIFGLASTSRFPTATGKLDTWSLFTKNDMAAACRRFETIAKGSQPFKEFNAVASVCGHRLARLMHERLRYACPPSQRNLENHKFCLVHQVSDGDFFENENENENVDDQST